MCFGQIALKRELIFGAGHVQKQTELGSQFSYRIFLNLYGLEPTSLQSDSKFEKHEKSKSGE
jgi:hypothetical protein